MTWFRDSMTPMPNCAFRKESPILGANESGLAAGVRVGWKAALQGSCPRRHSCARSIARCASCGLFIPPRGPDAANVTHGPNCRAGLSGANQRQVEAILSGELLGNSFFFLRLILPVPTGLTLQSRWLKCRPAKHYTQLSDSKATAKTAGWPRCAQLQCSYHFSVGLRSVRTTPQAKARKRNKRYSSEKEETRRCAVKDSGEASWKVERKAPVPLEVPNGQQQVNSACSNSPFFLVASPPSFPVSKSPPCLPECVEGLRQGMEAWG